MAELTREVARRTPEVAPAASAPRVAHEPATQGVVPAGVGNAAIARLVAGPRAGGPAAYRSPGGLGISFGRRVQPRLRVTDPGEPAEREAESVAQHVVRVGTPMRVSTAAGAPQRQGLDEPSGGEAPEIVEQVVRSPGPGEALDDDVRARVEPVLSADLGPVRVHRDDRAQAAAVAIQARAFTVGAHIFLGPGESPADLALMAHEATHVVQQQAVQIFRVGHPVRGPPTPSAMTARQAMRAIPGADGHVGHAASDIAQEIPGYVLLCQVVGEDLITGDPVRTGPEGLLEALLSHGPFAGAFGAALKTLDVLGRIVDLVRSRLADHHLTMSRFMQDISAAWDEISLVEGIDYNVAIVERYVDRILADVRAFVSDIVNDVLTAVRAAAAAALQPLLDRPEVKPYWDLATKVFHYDPLRGVEVQAPTVEILADFLHLAGRDAVLAQMQERGTLQQTADWLDTQFARFGRILADTAQLFSDAWDAISPANLVDLPTRLPQLVDRAIALVREVAAFVTEILITVLRLIKDALLGWLSEHAHELRGFRLLTVILGRNPFTGAAVDRTAENLIGGFIALLPNGEATYQQLAQSGVIARTAGRIDSEMSRLGISWELITGTFKAVWDSLSLEDLLAPIAAFERVLRMFGEPLGRIVDFIIVVVQAIIELILALMGFPSDLLGHIIDQVSQAITDIMNDPVAFLLHLIDALKQGLSSFFDHVLTHLLNGLTEWLFRGLRGLGIEPPTSISLEAIITLVIQVLGITAEALWAKLAEKIGPDKVQMMRGAIDRLGQAWAFITDVSERGITAVWEFLQGQLSNLWDMILNTAKDWIMKEIVEKVTTKLLSMLDPTGIMAVVNSAIAFFKAIQSAIEYLTDILRIVDGWVSTVAAIAKGAIQPGAQRLESGFAAAIPVAIGFLANQVGLGDVPEKVREIILSLRELFWEAVGWVIDQAIRLGQAAIQALGLGPKAPDEAPPPQGPATPLTEEERQALYARVQAAVPATAEQLADEKAAKAMLNQLLTQFAPQGLKALELEPADPAQPGRFKLIASASAGREVGYAGVSMKLNVNDILTRRGTSAMAWINGSDMGVFAAGTKTVDESDHKAHAENWLLTLLTTRLSELHTGGENVLLVKITRSPCSECWDRIVRRQTQLRDELDRPLRIDLQVASVHRGNVGAGVDQFVTMAMLQNDHFTLTAWHVLDELDELGFSSEQINELKTQENARWLENRIAQVEKLLAAVADLRVATSGAPSQ